MVKQLIARMRDPSEEAREAAQKELTALARTGTLSIPDAVELIREAAGSFPEPKYAWSPPAPYLVYAARDIARDRDPEQLLPEIDRCFPEYTAETKRAALQILAMAASPAAADMYVRLLETHGESLGDGYVREFQVAAGPEVAAALFPRMIALARNHNLAHMVFRTLLEFRQAGLVPPEVAKEHHGSILAVLKAEVQQAAALQRASGLGWRDEPPYAQHRDMVGLLFDLVGTLSSRRLADFVASCEGLIDPRLRRFRAIALLNLRRDVSDDELERIARSPRDRYWLFQQLKGLELDERLPGPCLDQGALAEGHMVDWLCFGTELGREPDEMETIHVETRNRSEAHLLVRWLAKRRPVDYYFFKYRVVEDHWSKERGWMVGMAGGYARDEQPTTSHDGGTFSKFEPFESKSVRAHVADYLG